MATSSPWSINVQRTLSVTTVLSATYGYHLVQQLNNSNETHTLDVTLRMQLQVSLSAAFSLQASLGTGYEEPEWMFDVSFKYDLF